MNKLHKYSQIRINVGLDEGKNPVDINWDADDSPNTGNPAQVKAMLLSLFDRENLDTFKIDVWTNDMQIYEMDRFVFQTLRGLADTYFKATNNRELAVDMQKFIHYFGEKTGILKDS